MFPTKATGVEGFRVVPTEKRLSRKGQFPERSRAVFSPLFKPGTFYSARKRMTRKDSEKDVDRPHYYSQFWLDIAAGRRVIGGPRPEDEAGEAELPEPTPVPVRKNGRNSTVDSYKETRPIAATSVIADEEDEEVEPSEEEFQQEDLVDEDEIPNIILDDEAAIHDESAEESEDESSAEDEEDEEEDEEEWGTRGRKKAKPVRPVKPVKKPKPRRGF